MSEPTQPIEKLELEREIKSPLLVYCFIVHQPEVKLKDERCALILAYDLESAFIRAGQEAKNLGVFYTGQKVPVSEFISKLHLDNAVFLPTQNEEIIEIPKEKLSLERFKAGLLMVLEDYVNPEDKKILKQIIKKI